LDSTLARYHHIAEGTVVLDCADHLAVCAETDDLIWRAACQVGMVKRCPRPSSWTPLRWPDGSVVTSVSGVDASSV
jgi:hypothetical protein